MFPPNSQSTPSLYLHSGGAVEEADFWPVTQSLLIGREHADITLSLPAMSRRHALVQQVGASWCIEDLNSKNGTAVNGTLLTKSPHWLKNGDSIVLGGVVELRFYDPQATPLGPRLGSLRGLWIDDELHEVWIDAEKLSPPLSNKQLSLLQVVVEANGRIVSKSELIERVWPERPADIVSNDTVDSLVKRIRRRLTTIEHGEPVLEVIRGQGIRLKQNRVT